MISGQLFIYQCCICENYTNDKNRNVIWIQRQWNRVKRFCAAVSSDTFKMRKINAFHVFSNTIHFSKALVIPPTHLKAPLSQCGKAPHSKFVGRFQITVLEPVSQWPNVTRSCKENTKNKSLKNFSLEINFEERCFLLQNPQAKKSLLP